MTKVLVLGSGGREHAIVCAIAKSKNVSKIYAAPGNAGMVDVATCVCLNTIAEMVDFAKKEKIDLTIVGPEALLVEGIVDAFHEAGLTIFGPTKKAAQVESSKEFAKNIMKKVGIPTADFQVFNQYEAALHYIAGKKFPIVLKYDGLAAGKGVIIAQDEVEAKKALKELMVNHEFGQASVVIEEYLSGLEFSFMCMTDGQSVYPLALAQDHKRAYDGDLGPNTGGMGAYSPVPFINEKEYAFAYHEIMEKMVLALKNEGCTFQGILYGGLMKTATGIQVIEFNCRFGDPETEVVLPRLKSDLYDAMMAVLAHQEPVLEWDERWSLGIVLATKGYPQHYEKGYLLENIPQENVYHMGTKWNEKGQLVTNGGRVLFALGMAETLKEANEHALKIVSNISNEHLFYRTDIGQKVLKK